MSDRAVTPRYVDAATVFAEGVLSGLRTAANLVGRSDVGLIPPELSHAIMVWRSVVYHNQWLAMKGRPADLPPLPDRTVLMARIDAFLALFPDADELFSVEVSHVHA